MKLSNKCNIRVVVEFAALLAAVVIMSSWANSAEPNLRQHVEVTVKTGTTITSGRGVYLGSGIVAVEKHVTQGSLDMRAGGSAGAGTVVSEGRGRGVGLIKLDSLPAPAPKCDRTRSYYRQTPTSIKLDNSPDFSGRYHQRKRTSRFFRLVSDTQVTPTPTQQALIDAVRAHPDAPASTNGTFDPMLAKEAERHSAHQARIQRQGHHNWDRRFRRINAALPAGLTAQEVCAESWPGESLAEAAAECVNSWRQSPGHWKAVSGECLVYGYDMKRGRNGIWYATGILGQEAH